MRWLVVLALLFGLGFPLDAAAQRVMHRVRFGETFSGISKHYYGTRAHEDLLRQVNGYTSGRKLQPGERLRIPTAWVHHPPRRTTVPKLAKELLGHAKRAPVLAHFNKLRRVWGRVAAGKPVLVPYLMNHRVTAGETVADLAKRYYGREKLASVILAHNRMRRARLKAGQQLVIPTVKLRIPRWRLELLTRERLLGLSEDRVNPAREGLQEANAMVRRGHYWAVPLRLVRLLAGERPSDTQVAEVFKLLAVAYVALDHKDLAAEAFREVLLRQPTYTPDPVTTSPKVIQIFQATKTGLKKKR